MASFLQLFILTLNRPQPGISCEIRVNATTNSYIAFFFSRSIFNVFILTTPLSDRKMLILQMRTREALPTITQEDGGIAGT